MTKTSKRILEIIEQLTEDEQRRLLWQAIQMLEPEQPEPDDIEAIEQADAEMVNGECVRHDEINWQ